MVTTYHLYNAYQNNHVEMQQIFIQYNFLKGFEMMDELIKLKKTSDAKIYTMLYEQYHKSVLVQTTHSLKYRQHRSEGRAKIIFSALLPAIRLSKKQITTYLDLGSGDGLIAEAVGKKLGLSNPHCLDIESDEFKNLGKCVHQTYNGYDMPYDANKLDLLTASHVLHHVEELNLLMANISRVMVDDGLVYVNDHHATPDIIDLIHVQHILPAIASGQTYQQFNKSYYYNYMTISDLQKIMNRHGFRPIFKTIKLYGITKNYNQIFSKSKKFTFSGSKMPTII